MRLLIFALAIAFVHLWTGALSGEGTTKVHRLARISAITGLVVVLAFSLAMVWASLSFPPGIFGNDMLYLAIASITFVATTITSLGLSIALHLRARRGQA